VDVILPHRIIIEVVDRQVSDAPLRMLTANAGVPTGSFAPPVAGQKLNPAH